MANLEDERARYTPFLKYRIGTYNRKRRTVTGQAKSKPGSAHQTPVSTYNKTRPTGSQFAQHEVALDVERPLQSPTATTLTLYKVGGGTQQDPFNSLPGNPNIPEVGNAFDFCMFDLSGMAADYKSMLLQLTVKILVLSIWSRTRPSAQSVNTFIPALVSEAMRKESLLKALVVYGQGYQESIHQKQLQPSAVFLSRLGWLLEHLRRLLLRPNQNTIDEAILLIYMLIGIGVSLPMP